MYILLESHCCIYVNENTPVIDNCDEGAFSPAFRETPLFPVFPRSGPSNWTHLIELELPRVLQDQVNLVVFSVSGLAKGKEFIKRSCDWQAFCWPTAISSPWKLQRYESSSKADCRCQAFPLTFKSNLEFHRAACLPAKPVSLIKWKFSAINLR